MNNNAKKGLGVLALVLLFLLTAGLIVRNAFQIVHQNPELGRLTGSGVLVRAAKAETRQYKETIGAPGDALPSFDLNLAKSRGVLADRVSRIHVELGDYVRPGQPLVEFDTGTLDSAMTGREAGFAGARSALERTRIVQRGQVAELRAAARAAEANVTSAESTLARDEANYKRISTLYDDGLVSRFDFEDALRKRDESQYNLRLAEQDRIHARNAITALEISQQTEMHTAEAGLADAESALKDAQSEKSNVVLTSPIEAVVTDRPVQAGEWVAMGQKLVGLGQIDPIHVESRVAQEKVTHAFVGQEGTVTFDALPSEVFSGQIIKIDPSIDRGTGTFKATLRIANPDGRIRPGMSGFTRLRNDRSVLSIPRLGIIGIPMEGQTQVHSTPGVFVIDGDVARLRAIRIGDEIGDGQVEIIDGLKVGESVIIHGLKDLQDGDKVKVLN